MSPLSSQHGFVRRAARLVAVAAQLSLVALTQSCATGPGEGENSCEADVDADGDGASGCDDSDCHRFELCRKSFPLGDDGGGTGGSSDQGGSGGSTTPAGGMSGGTVSPGGSGGIDEGEDAGEEIDAGECSCGPGELCTDAGCVPVEPPMPRYVVALMSAVSPIGTPGPPPHGLCVEIACREPGAGSPVGFCPCEPEPYVRVIHIGSPVLDPIETVVLMTKVQGTSLSVTFDDSERAEVPLQMGDKLRFELWDDNVTTPDSLIYSCEPDLDAIWPMLELDPTLAMLPLDCSVLSGALATEECMIDGALIVQK